jgi:hypothetical protein
VASFLLVPSPLVDSTSWRPVATELAKRGHMALVPELEDDGAPPFWRQHIDATSVIGKDIPVVVAGHSGAGPLLPAIADHVTAVAFLFVDAGLPRDGASRLDLLAAELPEMADGLRAHLQAGGRFPEWTDGELATVVPDPDARRRVLAGLRPRPLSFWEEPIPVPAEWPGAPCAYLQFSPGYDRPAQQAADLGWRVKRLEGADHFHLIVDAPAVADALIGLATVCGHD